MIDTHTHLQFSELKNDIEGVLARAREAGVTKFVVPSTDIVTSGEAILLAQKYPEIHAAIGVHPCDIKSYGEDTLSEFAAMVDNVDGLVAMGEVGLDYYHFEEGKTDEEIADLKLKQQQVFIDMITLAKDFHVPLIIHSREAFEDTFQILEEQAPGHPTVIHCFTGTTDEAKAWVDLGCLISVTGIITYKKNQALRDMVKTIPMDMLMLETDSPFLAPEGYRSKVCEPMYVAEVAKCVAEIKGITVEEVDEITTENAESFFGI